MDPSLLDAPWVHTLRFVLEVAATIAFALSGVIAAARKRLDAVGVCVLAFVAAACCFVLIRQQDFVEQGGPPTGH